MQVTPIAMTTLLIDVNSQTDMVETLGLPRSDEGTEEDTERLIEFAGRSCYQSFNRPNADTANTRDYVKNILKQEHFSVLEHASVSFYVTGVSRNMLLELERHRHISFSVESQRFVDAENTPVTIPPALQDLDTESDTLPRLWAEAHEAAKKAYTATLDALSGKGLTRKQRREAARAILPGGLATQFVVTGNLRAWRDVLKKRYSVHADAEICQFATIVLEWLKVLAPSVFSDFPEEPYSV